MLDALIANKPTEQEVLEATERIRKELEDRLSTLERHSRAYAYADWLMQYIQEQQGTVDATSPVRPKREQYRGHVALPNRNGVTLFSPQRVRCNVPALVVRGATR